MTQPHYVRGYDKATDRPGAAFRLSAPAVKAAHRVVSAPGLQGPPEGLVYDLEAEEHPHTVAGIRDAARNAA